MNETEFIEALDHFFNRKDSDDGLSTHLAFMNTKLNEISDSLAKIAHELKRMNDNGF